MADTNPGKLRPDHQGYPFKEGGNSMKAATKIGLVTGGVVGAALGAGLLMNQGHQLRKAAAWGADQVKHALHNRIG
jgi:hypothetical protein